MLGRSKYQRSGTLGSCPLKHGPLPADTVTHLPTHSLRNEGDDVWASDTEIETAALLVGTWAESAEIYRREGKTCSRGGKECDRGVLR